MEGFKLKKFWYFVISFTWGLPMNLVGLIVTSILLITGHKPEKNIYGWAFRVGNGWGGVNLGVCSVISKECGTGTKIHEFGHSIQACIFGPFVIFFVVIPSVTRYWIRRYQEEIKGITNLPDYDYAWFEGQATMFGQRYRDLH